MSTDIVKLGRPEIDGAGQLPATQHRSSRRLPTAAQVMSRHPAIVDAHTSLFSAWGRLHGEHNRHLVVIDDGVRPIGVIDERDIALEWPPGPLGAHHLPIHQLVRFRSRPRVRSSDDMAKVAQTMLGSRTDALPVVDEDGRLVGLITVWHCVELIAAARAAGAHEVLAAESAPLGIRKG